MPLLLAETMRAPQRLNWHMCATPECILQNALGASREVPDMPIDVTLAILRVDLPHGQT